MDRSNSSSFSLPQSNHDDNTSHTNEKELLNKDNIEANQKSSIESSSDESEGQSGNARMRRFPPDAKTSKYRGVSLLKNRGIWRARVEYKGKREHLGYFESEETAAEAYDDRLLQLFGKKSKFNFPDRITSKLLQESAASSLSLSSASPPTTSLSAPVQHQSRNKDNQNINTNTVDSVVLSSNMEASVNSSRKRERDSEGSKNYQPDNIKNIIVDDAKVEASDMFNTSPQSLLGTPPLMNYIDNIHSVPYPLHHLGSQLVGNRMSSFPSNTNNHSSLANRSRNNELFGFNRLDNVVGPLGIGASDTRLSQSLLFNHSLSSSLLLPFTNPVNANQLAFPTLINSRYSLPDITLNRSFDTGNMSLYPARVLSSPPQQPSNQYHQHQIQSGDEEERQNEKEDSQPKKKPKKR